MAIGVLAKNRNDFVTARVQRKERSERAFSPGKTTPFRPDFLAFCGAFVARLVLPRRSAAQFEVNGRIANSVSLGFEQCLPEERKKNGLPLVSYEM